MKMLTKSLIVGLAVSFTILGFQKAHAATDSATVEFQTTLASSVHITCTGTGVGGAGAVGDNGVVEFDPTVTTNTTPTTLSTEHFTCSGFATDLDNSLGVAFSVATDPDNFTSHTIYIKRVGSAGTDVAGTNVRDLIRVVMSRDGAAGGLAADPTQGTPTTTEVGDAAGTHGLTNGGFSFTVDANPNDADVAQAHTGTYTATAAGGVLTVTVTSN